METGNLFVDAQTAFARQRRRRVLARMRCRILRAAPECSRLRSLESVLGAAPPAGRRTAGTQPIPLDSIVGTAESAKARAFDHRFRPPPTSRRRWEGLWIAARRGAALPPVSVYRLGDEHFLLDGHHRVSVAHDLGMAAIDAEVTRLDGAVAA
ncbi:MAG TPA: hypothetical protein VGF25_19415 [Thermoleophilaceae bacterium]|jgi:hypothetical protein